MPDARLVTPEDRIIDAAMALIAEKGLAAVTISGVAKGAGVARQTVYNHFVDVDAIIVAVQRQHDPTNAAHMDALLETAATPKEMIELYVRHSIASHGQGEDAMALRSSLGPDAREEMDAHRVAAREVLASIVEAGVKDGSFSRDLDPIVSASLINGMLSGLDGLGGGSHTSPELSVEVIRAALRMLGA
jgi:AcrR family transcriptional regulator